jgi:hypothetical protein
MSDARDILRAHLRETAGDWEKVRAVLPKVPEMRRQRDASETAEERAMRLHREQTRRGH